MAKVMLKGGPFDGEAMDWSGGSTIEKAVTVDDASSMKAASRTAVAVYRQDFGNDQVLNIKVRMIRSLMEASVCGRRRLAGSVLTRARRQERFTPFGAGKLSRRRA